MDQEPNEIKASYNKLVRPRKDFRLYKEKAYSLNEYGEVGRYGCARGIDSRDRQASVFEDFFQAGVGPAPVILRIGMVGIEAGDLDDD